MRRTAHWLAGLTGSWPGRRAAPPLRRDGIAVNAPEAVMPTLAHLAAAMLGALGVHPEAQDGDDDGRG